MLRFEYALGAGCALTWVLAIALRTPWLCAAGRLDLDLYKLYGIGAMLGWLSGNVYVARRRRWRQARWPLIALYASGPVSVLLLLRSLASGAQRQATPLVPLYAVIVYWIFFFVPISFRSTR